MKLPIYRFRNLHLVVLFNVWVLLILWNERLVPRHYAKRCHWPQEKGYGLLLVADPQLIDSHTYPGRPKLILKLLQHVTNNYLYKNYRMLLEVLSPKSVVFLGDYMDNGRLDFENTLLGSTLQNYETELQKFKFIFGDEGVMNVPGNHDIGWENGVSEEALDRFHKNFGLTNVVIERNSHDLILLDTLSLSNTANESIYGPPREFVEKLSHTEKLNPRILFTHVPLWKTTPSQCGSLRESLNFPISKGFQYQTVLSEQLSTELLTKLKPDLIFSGDDHDYCEYNHQYGDNEVIEVTIKSISMAMGINRPAVQLLTLYRTPSESGKLFLYNICYLPKPYNEVIIYCSILFATVVSLIISVFIRSNSISIRPVHTKEIPVTQERLSSYLDPQLIDQFTMDNLRGSYTYYTNTFNKRKTHSRFNWVLLWQNLGILFIAVFIVYWLFVKDVLLL